MKYSHLAVVVTSLLGSLGEPDPADYTDYQEDCAGKALLSAGLSVFRLKGNYRDVPRINVGELSVAQGQVQQSLRPALQLGLSSYVAGSPLAPKLLNYCGQPSCALSAKTGYGGLHHLATLGSGSVGPQRAAGAPYQKARLRVAVFCLPRAKGLQENPTGQPAHSKSLLPASWQVA